MRHQIPHRQELVCQPSDSSGRALRGQGVCPEGHRDTGSAQMDAVSRGVPRLYHRHASPQPVLSSSPPIVKPLQHQLPPTSANLVAQGWIVAQSKNANRVYLLD